MLKTSLLIELVALAEAFWLCGCGGGGSSDPGSNTTSTSSNNPPSISGQTFNFTVTARKGLSEPVGSTYSIMFGNAGTYTFNPSPQNLERTNPVSGPYTYESKTATVQLTGPAEPVTGTLHFSTPNSGVIHWMEMDGEMQDATFTEF